MPRSAVWAARLVLVAVLAACSSTHDRSGGATTSSAAPIYIADFGNARIIRIDDLSGSGWTVFSDANRVAGPEWVDVDRQGHLYVVDFPNNRIVRLDDMTGQGYTSYGTQGSGPGQFLEPSCIDVAADGHIYVTDSGNNRVVRIDDMTGAGWTTYGPAAGPNALSIPYCTTVGPDGRIYITDKNNNRIVRIDDMTGKGFTTFGGPRAGRGTGQFAFPEGITVTTDHIYVTDYNNNRIVRIDDMTGAGWVTYGVAGLETGAGVGQLAGPTSVIVDSQDRLLIADYRNARLVHIDNIDGAGWTTYGADGHGTNQLHQPTNAVAG
jgi:streptogramin lyase